MARCEVGYGKRPYGERPLFRGLGRGVDEVINRPTFALRGDVNRWIRMSLRDRVEMAGTRPLVTALGRRDDVLEDDAGRQGGGDLDVVGRIVRLGRFAPRGVPAVGDLDDSWSLPAGTLERPSCSRGSALSRQRRLVPSHDGGKRDTRTRQAREAAPIMLPLKVELTTSRRSTVSITTSSADPAQTRPRRADQFCNRREAWSMRTCGVVRERRGVRAIRRAIDGVPLT